MVENPFYDNGVSNSHVQVVSHSELDEFQAPTDSKEDSESYSRENDLLVQIEGYCKQLSAQKEYITPADIAVVANGDKDNIQSVLEETEDFVSLEQEGTTVFENPFFVRGD